MGKRNTKDKRSMRHTPQNKIRSIERNIIKCDVALFKIIEKQEQGSTSEEAREALQERRVKLEAHIMHLKRCKSAWSNAKT
jgi:hypothetical protein